MKKCSCQFETYHKFFSNLANPLKIRIILSLRENAKNVGSLSKELNVEQSKLSHALKSLKSCNIAKANRSGKQKIYFLNSKTIEPMLNLIDIHAKTQCKECPFRK